jgi:hypothetical protein
MSALEAAATNKESKFYYICICILPHFLLHKIARLTTSGYMEEKNLLLSTNPDFWRTKSGYKINDIFASCSCTCISMHRTGCNDNFRRHKLAIIM